MKHINLKPELCDYIVDVSLREHPSLQRLRKETSSMALANMQVAPEQAQFMQLLLRTLQAKKVLELGTFTGYSALAMALALPDNGKLITCDRNPEWTSKALYFWREANQEHKIELRLGQALDTMHELLRDGAKESFDFIFIDGDKTNYVQYYELALQLITPQGLIAIDNVFWHGKVIDEQELGGQTREIRKLNALIKNDPRVHICLLPIGDGLFLLQRVSE